jgi:hypothetical protein
VTTATTQAHSLAFGPCKRHSRNGVAVAADHADGLCAACRSAALAVPRYNGSKPLASEVPHRVPNPKGGTPPPNSSARKRKRLAEFETILTERYGRPLDRHVPIALIREAGIAVGVGESTAVAYRRELLRGSTP